MTVKRIKVAAARLIYRAAHYGTFTLWCLPGPYELSIWAEETLREHRSMKLKERYAKLSDLK